MSVSSLLCAPDRGRGPGAHCHCAPAITAEVSRPPRLKKKAGPVRATKPRCGGGGHDGPGGARRGQGNGHVLAVACVVPHSGCGDGHTPAAAPPRAGGGARPRPRHWVRVRVLAATRTGARPRSDRRGVVRDLCARGGARGPRVARKKKSSVVRLGHICLHVSTRCFYAAGVEPSPPHKRGAIWGDAALCCGPQRQATHWLKSSIWGEKIWEWLVANLW